MIEMIIVSLLWDNGL